MTCQSCHTVSSRCLLQNYGNSFLLFCLKMALSAWYFAFHSERNVIGEQRRTHVDWLPTRAAAPPARWLSSTLWLWTRWCAPALWFLGDLRLLYRLHDVTKIEEFIAKHSETLKVRTLQLSSTSCENLILMVYVTKLLVCVSTYTCIVMCKLALCHSLA